MPGKTENLEERQEAIRTLLSSLAIHRQQDLLPPLAEQGFDVTLSSVSRDLQELGAVKLDGRYRMFDSLTQEAPASDALRELAPHIVSCVPAGANLLVAKARPGLAPALAAAIDAAEWHEVVGTVAGDDTIFVACNNRDGQRRVQTRLTQLQKRNGA